MEELIKKLQIKTTYNIGDRAYMNLPDGVPVVIIGYCVYSTHIEYQVRYENGVMQLEGESLVDNKVII